jgi:hypothetical protein
MEFLSIALGLSMAAAVSVAFMRNSVRWACAALFLTWLTLALGYY